MSRLFDFGEVEITIPEYVSGEQGQTGEAMSVEEWDEMVSDFESAVNFSCETTIVETGSILTTIAQIDGSSDPFSAYYMDDTMEAYLVCQDGVYYNVMEQQGKWVGMPTENVGAQGIEGLINSLVPKEAILSVLNYKNFQYNANDDNYQGTVDGVNIVITVANGQLIRYEAYYEEDSVVMEFYAYGTTEIDCPNFSIPK